MLKNIVKGLEPSSTLKINEISRKLEDKGEKIFKFGFGQSPFQIPTDIVNALKDNAYPVLYTHFRSHEIPDHLVCLLLLEKKNITYTKLRYHNTVQDIKISLMHAHHQK